MAPLPLRVRLLGAVLRRFSVVRLTDEQVVARQSQGLGHNPVLDRLFGGLAGGVDVTNTSTQTPDGPVGLRVYRPTGAGRLPLVVFFHGGGWVGGDLDGYDWLASQMALGAQVVVVSVDYRLAPTHRWPGPVDDCYAAMLDAVARSEEWNADASRLAVVGDSAGGNLAAVVALKARDEGGPRIAFQGLIYPSTDMLSDAPSFTENAHAPILDRAEATAYKKHYLPNEADWAHPYASPARAADHSGLPAALVQVAEHDPLRGVGLRYAQILRDAGVPVRATTYVGEPHGFMSLPGICHSAPQAMAELTSELRTHLA